MNIEKIAVIMSVYRSDSLEHLELAVGSILDQEGVQFTLYIYRDGEVPHDLDVYLSSLQKLPSVELIISGVNNGLAYGLNQLIDIVLRSEVYAFVARMDSDDVSRPERLSKQLAFFSENPEVDVCGTYCEEFGASFALKKKCLPESHDKLIDFSVAYCPFIHPTVMFRTNVFKSGLRYPSDTTLTEDMALWFILLNKGYRFANLPEVLLDYRLNEATVARRSGFRKGLSEFRIRLKNMRLLGRVTLKNCMLVASRLIFHILPLPMIRFAYKFCR